MPAPASEEIIERTERDIGTRFPPDHRARLSAENGGSIAVTAALPDETWQMYPVSDTTNSRDMQRTAESISLQTSLVRFEEGFPAGAVVVGHSSAGDLLLQLPDGGYERWNQKAGTSAPVTVGWGEPAAPAVAEVPPAADVPPAAETPPAAEPVAEP